MTSTQEKIGKILKAMGNKTFYVGELKVLITRELGLITERHIENYIKQMSRMGLIVEEHLSWKVKKE